MTDLCPNFILSCDGDLFHCVYSVGHSGKCEYYTVDSIEKTQKQWKDRGISLYPLYNWDDMWKDLEDNTDVKKGEDSMPNGGWNYRVIKKKYDADPDAPYFYHIHEVYYESKDKDDIVGWSQDPMCPMGETIEELKSDLLMMRAAFCEPILNEWELPGYADDDEDEDGDIYDPLDAQIFLAVDTFVREHRSFDISALSEYIDQTTDWDSYPSRDYIGFVVGSLFDNGEMPGYAREIRGTGDFYYHKSDYMAQQYAEWKKNRPYKCDIWGKHYIDNGEPVKD